MQLSQMAKIVGCGAPIDTNGAGLSGDIVGLKEYDHVTFLVYVGNVAGDITLTVEECDTIAPGANTAIAFNYRKASAGAAGSSELDGALTAAGTGGITIANATDDNKLIAIEIDAAELTDGYPYVRVLCSDPSAAGLVAIIAILSQARYLKDVPPSAID